MVILNWHYVKGQHAKGKESHGDSKSNSKPRINHNLKLNCDNAAPWACCKLVWTLPNTKLGSRDPITKAKAKIYQQTHYKQEINLTMRQPHAHGHGVIKAVIWKLSCGSREIIPKMVRKGNETINIINKYYISSFFHDQIKLLARLRQFNKSHTATGSTRTMTRSMMPLPNENWPQNSEFAHWQCERNRNEPDYNKIAI